eukprot:GHVT01011983.1.p1 GENE.GHVT01011983.1~~GHVT01011983.1.p1  ORF type:complete len:686 (-),score=59.43 GHVT01011983.1:3798-5855(-)
MADTLSDSSDGKQQVFAVNRISSFFGSSKSPCANNDPGEALASEIPPVASARSESRRETGWLMFLLTTAMMISYADRSNISSAIPRMADEFSWDKEIEGLILSSFLAGYALSQVIGGYWADTHGGGRVLVAGLAAWSICTTLTPLAADFGIFPLTTTRVLLGIAEGVAYPAAHTLISKHVPQSLQSTAVALITAGSYFGVAVSFAMSPFLLRVFGWRASFVIFGAIAAFLWLPLWYYFGPKQKIDTSMLIEDEISSNISIGDITEVRTKSPKVCENNSDNSSCPTNIEQLSSGKLATPDHAIKELNFAEFQKDKEATTDSGTSSVVCVSPRDSQSMVPIIPRLSQRAEEAQPPPPDFPTLGHTSWGVVEIDLDAGGASEAAIDSEAQTADGVKATIKGKPLTQSHCSRTSSPANESPRQNTNLALPAKHRVTPVVSIPKALNQRQVTHLPIRDSLEADDDDADWNQEEAETLLITSASPASVVLISPKGWLRTLTFLAFHKNVWAILICQYCQSWGMLGLINWLPTYVEEMYNLKLLSLAAFTTFPYVTQGIVATVAGKFADYALAKGWSVLVVRGSLQSIAMLGASFFLLIAVVAARSAFQAAIAITLGTSISALSCAAVSVSQLDIAPQLAGVIFGAGNTAGVIGGLLAVVTTGWVLERTGSWLVVFGLFCLHYVVGAFFWLL